MESPRGKPGPVVAGVEITRRCNLACPHCYTAAGKELDGEMTTAECKAILEALASLGTSLIGWTGGEPLLRDDLEDLAAHARALGMRSSVTTNGVLLDDPRARSLEASGMTSVQVSIDGSTAERNRRMRGATDEEFARALEGVRAARRAGLRVHLAMVLTRESVDDGPAYLDLARAEIVDSVRFCGFVPSGRGRGRGHADRLSFSGGRGPLREFVREALADGALRAQFDPAVGPLPPRFAFHKCVAGVETLYLSCRGDVYPCTSLLDRRFVVGNVRERPLEEIWSDPAMSRIADLDRDAIEGECRACPHFSSCRGGCRGVTFAYTRDLRASFPMCLRG